jgi:hypothetical protein
MFRTTKPPVPVRRSALGPSRLAPGRELENALEFASIPLDRIVPPADPVKPRALAAASLRTYKPEELSAAAKNILGKMTGEQSLRTLSQDFPRVLNRLADAWSRPRDFYALADSFLVDERGDRQGFPFAALQEISGLVEFFETHEAPRKTALHDATQFKPKI